MGLDMFLYLNKHEYVGSFDPNAENKARNFYPAELEELAVDIMEHNFMSKTTQYQVGYWRKANAIHNWFVQECADGVDECQEIYVSEEKLVELRDICDEILDCPVCARTTLPTKDGFFFGSQEYDEWYFNDIKYTRDLCCKVLKFLNKEKEAGTRDSWYIIYNASW